MEEGFVRFMRKWYYFVGVGIALLATMFAVFYPALAIVMLIAILAIIMFFAYYYWKYDIMKKERHPVRNVAKPTMMVEDVQAEASNMPDLEEMARLAAAGEPKVRGHMVEGSGMDLVERYFPLGEIMFPISFIANRQEKKFQEGSLEIGEPICLWHTIPVWFSASGGGDDPKYLVHCSKCPKPRGIQKSLDDTKKIVELVSVTTLRGGEMVMMDETMMDAVKRGRGELPG